MAWTYEITQLTDGDGNLIPLYTVTQWNTNNAKEKWQTTITQQVKEVAYPNE